MAAHGARRLSPMADNAMSIIGIELLAAAQACDFHRARSLERAARSGAGAAARARFRVCDDDRYFHPDIAAATSLVSERRRH